MVSAGGPGGGRPDAVTVSILRALAAGATTAEAAARCHLSESTLRRRLVQLRDAWGVGSNVEAVVIAVRRGLV